MERAQPLLQARPRRSPRGVRRLHRDKKRARREWLTPFPSRVVRARSSRERVGTTRSQEQHLGPNLLPARPLASKTTSKEGAEQTALSGT